MRIFSLAKIAAPALLLALSGCISLGGGGGKPPGALLTLTADQQVPAGSTTSGTYAGAILVMEPETDQRLAVVRIPVQVDDTQVAYLVGAAWVERPARLFRALLAETLRSHTGALVIEDTQAAPNNGIRLSGRLLDMGYDARTGSVVVRFDAMRTGANGGVTIKRFESIVPGIPAEAALVGPALNKAANDVARQVAAWLVS